MCRKFLSPANNEPFWDFNGWSEPGQLDKKKKCPKITLLVFVGVQSSVMIFLSLLVSEDRAEVDGEGEQGKGHVT